MSVRSAPRLVANVAGGTTLSARTCMDLSHAHSVLRLFDRKPAPLPQQRPATHEKEEARKDRRLFCALCAHPVTHQDERIAISGSHQHRCTNPAGYTFDIGCFNEAAGCVGAGAATDAHTWFKGYAWRVALCASCERHLGWRFEARAGHFHGLILERLTSRAGGEP